MITGIMTWHDADHQRFHCSLTVPGLRVPLPTGSGSRRACARGRGATGLAPPDVSFHPVLRLASTALNP